MAARTMQKERTRQAIADAARELVAARVELTMPMIAARARVSEATAYRYFPDLVTLLRESVADSWPDVADLVPLDGIDDVAERVARVTAVFCERTLAHERAVRAIVAASVTGSADQRPAHRFALIDHALAPLPDTPQRRELAIRLAVVISAESIFTLLDLCGQDPEQATQTLVGCARALV